MDTVTLGRTGITVNKNGFGALPIQRVSREEAQRYETRELIDRMYGGAADQLIASLLGSRPLSREQLDRVKRLVDELEEGER